MHTTDRFQKQTAFALRNANASCPNQVLQQDNHRQSRRFNIYRNNRMVSLIENLRACYPAICKLVGDEFFNACARQFVNEQPPKSPVMAEYGESFGEFIGHLPGTAKIPYIKDVAKLEWGRLQAHHQVNAEPLAIESLRNFVPEKLTQLRLVTHPTMTVIESRWAIASIWATTVHQQPAPDDLDVSSAESILILRPHLEVTVDLMEESVLPFVNALRQGESIEQAALCALKDDNNFNPGIQLQRLFDMGAFCAYAE